MIKQKGGDKMNKNKIEIIGGSKELKAAVKKKLKSELAKKKK